MNIMAQAHKAAKEFFASVTQTGLSYAKVLQIKLRVFHKEYKAMQKEQAIALLKSDTIAQFEKRISELQAVKETPVVDKWIVTCGGLPVDFEAVNQAWPWTGVEKASNWNSPQFARAYAQKIRNGSGEYGVAVNVGEYCTAEIGKLEGMINELKTA